MPERVAFNATNKKQSSTPKTSQHNAVTDIAGQTRDFAKSILILNYLTCYILAVTAAGRTAHTAAAARFVSAAVMMTMLLLMTTNGARVFNVKWQVRLPQLLREARARHLLRQARSVGRTRRRACCRRAAIRIGCGG